MVEIIEASQADLLKTKVHVTINITICKLKHLPSLETTLARSQRFREQYHK